MASDPWAKFNPQPAGSGPLPSPPKVVDPYQERTADQGDEHLDISRESLKVQQENLRLAKEKAAREAAADARKNDPREITKNLMLSAGVDPGGKKDRIADLINESTSGWLEHQAADAYGSITGGATSGMENIGKLKAISSDLVLQVTGGSLGNQISNSDRSFIVERMGDIANPDVPANQRLAAWYEVKARMHRIMDAPPKAKPKATPAGGNDGWTIEEVP